MIEKGFIKKNGKLTSSVKKPVTKSIPPNPTGSVKQPSNTPQESGRRKIQSFATIVSNATGSVCI